MNAPRPTPETFLVEAKLLLRSKVTVPMGEVPERDFRAHFGVGVAVCFRVWTWCEDDFRRKNILPKHLLWGLLFLKTYATEPILAAMTGVSRKSYRLWTWQVVATIAAQKFNVVSLISRDRQCQQFISQASFTSIDLLGKQVST